MTTKDKLSRYLDKNLFITNEEALKIGINKMMLSRLVKEEKIFRIEQGIYTNKIEWLTDNLKHYTVACTKYPISVIAGISSLNYHNLTDEREEKIWLAVEPPQKIESRNYRMIRPIGIAHSLGIEKHRFGKRTVRIYNAEKSVVDAFKYLWEEVAFKALKKYLKRKDRDVKKLCDYGIRLKKPLDNYITAILADE